MLDRGVRVCGAGGRGASGDDGQGWGGLEKLGSGFQFQVGWGLRDGMDREGAKALRWEVEDEMNRQDAKARSCGCVGIFGTTDDTENTDEEGLEI